ncbi:outer membrane beta-barrel protein [Ascidiimonas aurantiaca]|uniref:outer membrane beta-barrel protein n=1 Tax=Ascidiimonas aurantiaca TaxID=1685432 RepID=UPI0030EC93B7
MKKKLLFLLLLVLAVTSHSQIIFEKGYYINDSDQKIDCLIKNIDWKNNPVDFQYKLSEGSEIQVATIKTVKEFGVYGVSRYIRATVNMDRSASNVNFLDNKRNPEFKEEELFLKVLVEGKANLYMYEDGNLKRYFYNKGDAAIEPLVYKKYIDEGNKIGENNRFKQQLWVDLKCPDFSMNKIERLEYKKKDLVNFFTDYIKCNDQEFVDFEQSEKKDLFNLTIRPGLNVSSLSIENNRNSSLNTDFDSELGFRFGIEAEFILPFNKNKWAVIVEPTYQYYKSEQQLDEQTNVSVDYKSIELPVGIRHYFFLNENSKLFINGSVVFDLNNESSVIDFDPGTDLDEFKTRNNMAFGVGYKHNDRYSVEFRYFTNRELLGDFFGQTRNWSSDYTTFSVILGYSLF